MPDTLSIETHNLGRIYKLRNRKKNEEKQLVALQGVNLEVKQGELFGLLGPNGAGKTTLIKILTTLLAPSQGKALVSGFDVMQQPEEVRKQINMVSGGEASGYGLLTVRENLWMFAQFYGIPTPVANARIRALMEKVNLLDRINTKSSELSTGLRQKMNIVRGFLTDPRVLFLDEPTLGLDVSAALDVRKFVRSWIDEDPTRTLLLTTHYMVEADEMCDRVAIINKGQVLACDTPENLKHNLQREAIFEVVLQTPRKLDPAAIRSLAGVNRVSLKEQDGSTRLELFLAEEAALSAVIAAFTSQDGRILSLQKREPTLEDVFMTLVGRRMEEVEEVTDDQSAAH
jgi:ABC-2 type transport system ATP-binding protein